jgi:hypothetical protein
MAQLPDTLSYALWIVFACWVVAIIDYLIGGPRYLIIPLFFFGVFTGIVEWLLRHNTS